MIITMTPNPAWDITWGLDRLEVGETNRVMSTHTQAGGKGINVARVLTQQNFPAVAVAPVASSQKEAFAGNLEKAKIPHHLVGVGDPEAQIRRSVAIVDQQAHTTICNEAGYSLADSDWQRVTDQLSDVLALSDVSTKTTDPESHVMTISGSFPPGTPKGLIAQWINLAHSNSISVLVDSHGSGLAEAITSGADLVKPNVDELPRMGDQGIAASVHHILQQGVGTVVLTLGEDGMIFANKGSKTWWYAPVIPGIVGNPTGAGDSVLAALASHWGQTPDVLLAISSTWAASAVLSEHAGELDQEFLKNDHPVTVTEFPATEDGLSKQLSAYSTKYPKE